jgi:hypothetical protein
VQTRVIAVDERMGIVWLRMAWGVRERGGDQLTVWEMFKVYDGQIHAVEAFMRILPVGSVTVGGSKTGKPDLRAPVVVALLTCAVSVPWPQGPQSDSTLRFEVAFD